MNQPQSKLFSIGKILGGLFFCLIVSLGIYAASTVFVYAAWHCPSGNCETAAWVNISIFAIFASPLLIFATGAYLCRKAVCSLTQNKFLRFLLLAAFACFPVLLFAGLVVYAVNSTN